MPDIDASLSGTFAIGGDMVVNRLGFGAMRVTGPGIWGDPEDPAEARRTLKRAPELGVNLIDTAEAYGPYTSEELLAEVLAPYGETIIATKGGNSRPSAGKWVAIGRAEYIIQGAKMSARRLKVERIDLWQLHRIDPKTPREESFEAIAQLQKEGVIRHAGLSNVTVDDIEAAGKFFPVATVQNRYNVFDRADDPVVDYCEKNNIGYIPYRPIAAGAFGDKPEFTSLCSKYGVTPGQLALAWVLKRSPVILPIPGTGKVKHLEENTAAAGVTLSDEDFATLDRMGR
jgi:pyridoxine 4-dehydrogenase